jgi:HSP20 family protein
MRYRRMHFRYAMVLSGRQPPSIGDAWRAVDVGVMLAQPSWRPPADVYETPDAVAVTIELAGAEPDDLDVVLYEDALIIEGRRTIPPVAIAGVYHAAEIRQGPFRLEIVLPARVDPEGVDASFDRGLLKMILAKPTGDGHER